MYQTTGILFDVSKFERIHRLIILPAFFSGSVQLRLLICLILHPIVLEAAEAIGRSSGGEEVTLQLRNGKLTTEKAEAMVVQQALDSFIIKMLMAFFRRFMASVTPVSKYPCLYSRV